MPVDPADLSNAPLPMTPAGLDIRDCRWMPLEVRKVRESETAALEDPQAFRVNVFSWCIAWHQVPAASLPGDEKALARLFGYEFALPRWRKLRAAGALRGWVLCSDGRLYHPVVAEKAIEAASQMVKTLRKREADADRMARWRAERGGTESEWVNIRDAVLARDGWKCTSCGSPEDLHCDHVVPTSAGGPTTMENLTALCRPCHSRKTALSRGDVMHDIRDDVARLQNNTSPDSTGQDQSSTTPSPSSSPVLAPGDDGGARQRLIATDPYLVRVAVQRGDLLGVVRGFRANARPDRVADWLNATGGMQLGEVVAVMHSNDAIGRRIREPSGFRRATEAWRRLGIDERRSLGRTALDALGIPQPLSTT